MDALAPRGHNSANVEITIEVRTFNSLAKYGPSGSRCRVMSLPAGSTVGDLACRMGIPSSEIFLVLVNGRDITPGLVGDRIKDYHVIEEGDVVAFSGAVPYSYGYGSPVV